MTIQRISRCLTALLVVFCTSLACAQTLRIGLAEDPDLLDPTLARSFVGRIVFAAMCDKLLDIDEHLNIVPQLATAWHWSADNRSLTLSLRHGVLFQDGEKFDAEAVKFSIERHKTMPGSNRKGELAPVTTVDVLDPYTVRINLSEPFAPLLASLTDRSGMIVSPKAARALGDKFASHPVCAGPFKFAERIAQDRIVLERFPEYWNKGEIHFDKVIYMPIPDATVRLSNLRAGQLDFIERVAASDLPTVKSDPRFQVSRTTEIGYQGLTINIGKSAQAQANPLGRDKRVREALELSLDREGIVQVSAEGEADPGNQWVSPRNSYYAKSVPMPKRDVEKAKALLKAAGVEHPRFTLLTATTSEGQKVAQIIQAMAADAGFDVKIQAAEFATTLNLADTGQFDAMLLGWSGRPDPDGNLYSFYVCKQAQNYSGYCNPQIDTLINASRTTQVTSERQRNFDTIAEQVLADRPIIYLYHRHWLNAYVTKLSGFRPLPDGLIRVQGLAFR